MDVHRDYPSLASPSASATSSLKLKPPASIARIEKHRERLAQAAIFDTLKRKRVFVCNYKVGKLKYSMLENIEVLKEFFSRRARCVCIPAPPDSVRAERIYEFGGFSSDED